MTITRLALDDVEGTVTLEHDPTDYYGDGGVRTVLPIARKSWLVAHILRDEIARLMILTVAELQDLHLSKIKTDGE